MIAKYFFNFQNKIRFNKQMNYFVFLVVAITPLIYLPNPIDYSGLPKIMFLAFTTVIIFVIKMIRKDNENYLVLREDKLIFLYVFLLIISTFLSYNLRFSILGVNDTLKVYHFDAK